MRRAGVALLLGLIALGCRADAADPAQLAVGQIWAIEGEETMRAIVGRLEDWHGQPIVHISITGVPLPEDLAPPGTLTTVAHAPFTVEVFRASADEVLSADGTPDANFESGYAQWTAAKGGVFTISVPDAARLAVGAMRNAR